MTPDLRDVVDVRVLTPTQEGMLYHSLAEPDADVFHSQVVTTLPGDLDIDAFRVAWDTLVERHETLRSAFFWDGLDQPLQVVHPTAELPWDVHDWSARPPAEAAASLAALLERDRFTPFALDAEPLLRMRLVRQPDLRWTWVWTFHHVLLDGWSVRVLTRELTDLLESGAGTLPPPVPPSRHAEWIAGRDPAPSRHYWRTRLEPIGGPQHLDLPGSPAVGHGHDHLERTLPASLVERVTEAAKARRTTIGTLVTAAWSLVVSTITADPDVVIGVTTAGRPPQLPGVEDLVGMFLATLPLVTHVGHDTTTDDLVDAVHRGLLELVAHDDIGLPELHRLAGIRGSERLFESIVVVENLPPEHGAAGPGPFDDLAFHERSDFPLALLVTPGSPFTLRLVVDRARFAPAAAERLLAATVHALQQLTGPPRGLADLTWGDDVARLVGPALPAPTVTVVDEVAAVARTRGAATAVATATEQISYADFWDRVQALAGRLAAVGLGAGDRVGVLVPRSIDTIVALLGVQRAGAAYVPLDPDYPRAHLDRLTEAAGLSGVVVGGGATAPDGTTVVHVAEAAATPASAPPPPPALEDVAYVLHTSGSTGRPKGVVVTHRNLAASTTARSVHYDGAVDAFLLLSSTSFDSSVAGIFWTLTTGGCLVLPDPVGEQDPAHLRGLMATRGVSHLLALPGLHRVVAEEVGTLPDSLRCVIVAGEAVDDGVVAAHDRASGAALHNEYGPTEGTVWATVADLSTSPTTSIGRPVPGVTIEVVDHLGRVVPVGAAGELLLSGPGIAAGYLDDPAATAAAFVERGDRRWYRTGDRCAVDEEGEVRFLGRVDEQVKVRGHRIEPGEVEAALLAVDGVQDAVTRALDIDGSVRLVGWVVGTAAAPAVLQALRDRLPRHLVPAHVLALEAIPRLPNGKVDVAALPTPRATRDDRGPAPRQGSESVLAEVWTELLELEDVGVDEDFFDLGGDSLLAIRMVSRARRAGLEITPAHAVASPTIRGLARIADQLRAGEVTTSSCLVPIRPEGRGTPLVCIAAVNGRVLPFRSLAQHLDHDQPVLAFTAVGLDGTEEPLRSIEAMAARFVDELTAVQPDGPYRLLGECFGGSIGLEMARLLEARGHVVEQVVVIDGALPWEDARAVTLVQKARRALRAGGPTEVVRGLARRVLRRVRQARDLRGDDTDARFDVYRQRVFEASIGAFGSFTPSPVRAPVLLVRATIDDRPSGAGSDQPDWSHYTSHLTEVHVESDHLSMLQEPAVADVARLVTANA